MVSGGEEVQGTLPLAEFNGVSLVQAVVAASRLVCHLAIST
jgi:hypothetical protein